MIGTPLEVTLLVLAGAALMAVAIFAPRRPATRIEPAAEALRVTPAAPEVVAAYDEPVAAAVTLRWPQLVEPAAAGCDAPARIDLVDALAALNTEWAIAILRQALGEETDPSVRSAIAAALSSSQSLVT